jgi:hypothetical protein
VTRDVNVRLTTFASADSQDELRTGVRARLLLRTEGERAARRRRARVLDDDQEPRGRLLLLGKGAVLTPLGSPARCCVGRSAAARTGAEPRVWCAIASGRTSRREPRRSHRYATAGPRLASPGRGGARQARSVWPSTRRGLGVAKGRGSGGTARARPLLAAGRAREWSPPGLAAFSPCAGRRAKMRSPSRMLRHPMYPGALIVFDGSR